MAGVWWKLPCWSSKISMQILRCYLCTKIYKYMCMKVSVFLQMYFFVYEHLHFHRYLHICMLIYVCTCYVSMKPYIHTNLVISTFKYVLLAYMYAKTHLWTITSSWSFISSLNWWLGWVEIRGAFWCWIRGLARGLLWNEAW
jgi:hypothetical protein